MLQNFLLELEGKAAGRFFDAKGGSVEAEVVVESVGQGPIRHKHLAGVKYQDITLTCGTGMSRAFYEWLGTTFGGATSRKSGAIVKLNRQQAPVARLEFKDALVKSLILPALDQSHRSEAFMTVSISPEYTRSTPAEQSQKLGIYASQLPKAWNINDFRLKIDGLYNECVHVSRVGQINLGQKIVEVEIGSMRDAVKEAAKVEYSDLVIRLPGRFADGFYKWLDDFVVKGNNNAENEKAGVLEFFAPNSTKAYFELGFTGLGIYKLEGTSALDQKTALPITVTMFCEGMTFRAGPSAII